MLLDRLHKVALQFHESIVSLTSALSVSLLFCVGIGRYRFILVYVTYSFFNSVLSGIKPGWKIKYLFLPATLAAFYYDITFGPIFPVFENNYVLLALILMLAIDGLSRRLIKRLISLLAEGQLFVICSVCAFDNQELVKQCAKCGFDKGSQIPYREKEREKENTLTRMLQLGDDELILFRMKLFPQVSIMKNGVREVKTDFAITTKGLYLLDRSFVSESWREQEVLPFVNINIVKGRMKRIFLSQEPVLEIRTVSNDSYEFIFGRFSSFKANIVNIVAIIKEKNPQVEVKINFPEQKDVLHDLLK